MSAHLFHILVFILLVLLQNPRARRYDHKTIKKKYFVVNHLFYLFFPQRERRAQEVLAPRNVLVVDDAASPQL